MQKFEYTVLVTPKPVLEEMNNIGSEGWFILQVDTFMDGEQEMHRIYAGREIVAE